MDKIVDHTVVHKSEFTKENPNRGDRSMKFNTLTIADNGDPVFLGRLKVEKTWIFYLAAAGQSAEPPAD